MNNDLYLLDRFIIFVLKIVRKSLNKYFKCPECGSSIPCSLTELDSIKNCPECGFRLIRQRFFVFIITGKTGSGKSSFLVKLLERLRRRKISVSGILAKGMWRNGQKLVYEIQNIQTGKTLPLASRGFIENWNKTGNFYFNPEAILFGNKILTDPGLIKKDLIVLDEIGPFELDDKIWADSLSRLLFTSDCPIILVVRNKLIKKVIQKWKLQEPDIIDIEKVSVRQAEKRIVSKLGLG